MIKKVALCAVDSCSVANLSVSLLYALQKEIVCHFVFWLQAHAFGQKETATWMWQNSLYVIGERRAVLSEQDVY